MSASIANVADRHPPAGSACSDEQVKQVASGTSMGIAKWVRATANEFGISVRRTPIDKFAREVSRLSDGETDLDQVEELLIALSRAEVITQSQRGLLQVNYLR